MIRLMLIGIILVVGLNATAGAYHMATKLQARALAMEGR